MVHYDSSLLGSAFDDAREQLMLDKLLSGVSDTLFKSKNSIRKLIFLPVHHWSCICAVVSETTLKIIDVHSHHPIIGEREGKKVGYNRHVPAGLRVAGSNSGTGALLFSANLLPSSQSRALWTEKQSLRTPFFLNKMAHI